MEDNFQFLTQQCTRLAFGRPERSKAQNAFYTDLNNEITLTIKSLPGSVQTRVLLELMNHLGLSVRNASDFFAGFYTPAWSILYWLAVSFAHHRELTAVEMKDIKIVHASAMLLHLLDDHLLDGEIGATHPILLLRSQLWLFLNQALKTITEGISSGPAIAQGFVDDYTASIAESEDVESLEAYCDLFKRQMGTGFIAPILMTKKMTADDHLEKSVRSAYGAFGTAWRLLDDLQDIPQDLRAGTKSAVYFCLPEESRSCWEKHCRSEVSGEKGSSKDIVACLRDNNVTAKIQCRICCELDAAATISDACKLTGYADELRCLLKPLITSTRLHETGN